MRAVDYPKPVLDMDQIRNLSQWESEVVCWETRLVDLEAGSMPEVLVLGFEVVARRPEQIQVQEEWVEVEWVEVPMLILEQA